MVTGGAGWFDKVRIGVVFARSGSLFLSACRGRFPEIPPFSAIAMTPETEPLYFYYCNDGSTIEGPYEWEQIPELLEVGAVSRETVICLAGAEEWSALGDYLPPEEHEVGDAAEESSAESWAVEETEDLFESSDPATTLPRAAFVARLHSFLPTKRGKWAAAAGGVLLLALLGYFGASLLRQEGAEQTVPTNANIDAVAPTAERLAWAIEPRFQKADPFASFGVARVQLGGKWGLIDRTGRELLPCAYDEIEIFPKENCAAVREGSKWGLVDAEGKILAKPEWEEVQPLVNGFIPVKKDGKWGYADASGKLVIPCTWDNAWRFSAAGTAVVTKETQEGRKRGYIDKSGRVITELEWDGAQTMSPEGLGAVRRGNGWALVDKNGKVLGEAQWGMQWRLLRTDLGFLPVFKDGKWGLVAPDGTVLVEPAWDWVAPSEKGVLLSRPGTKSIFVGSGGETIFETGPWEEVRALRGPNDYDQAKAPGFAEGLLAVRSADKWGFIDDNGKTVIPADWDDVGVFSEGLVAVKNKSDRDGWKFLKADGSPAFANPEGLKIGDDWRVPRFRNGKVLARGRRYSEVAVDRNGKVVGEWSDNSWLPEDVTIEGTYFDYVSRYGRYGYMRNFADKDGKIFMRDVPYPMSTLADPFPYPGPPRYGLASASGKVLVEPTWDCAEVISPDWVRIWVDGRQGLVNAKGEQILRPEWQDIEIADNGLLVATGSALRDVANGSGSATPGATVNREGSTISGVTFRFFAPHADGVAVRGKFNGWRETAMSRDGSSGYWTAKVPAARPGQDYKFFVRWAGEKKGKWEKDPHAVWMRDGNAVVYDVESPPPNGIPADEQAGRRFVFDLTGKPLLPAKLDGAEYVDFYDDGFIARSFNPDGSVLWSLCDPSTTEPVSFENASRVYWNGDLAKHGLLWIEERDSGKWSLVKRDGAAVGITQEATPAKWLMPDGFGVLVKSDGTKIHIGADGKTLGTTAWEDANRFSQGFAAVKSGGKWGFIDTAGKTVIPPEWDEVGDFQNVGTEEKPVLLARVVREGKWGGIDANGRAVIEPQWEEMQAFVPLYDGRFIASVRQGELWGCIDPTGKTVVEPCGTEAGILESGLLRLIVQKEGDSFGRFVSFDADGSEISGETKQAIKANHRREGDSFGDGMVIAGNSEGKFGLKDAAGQFILPSKWNHIAWIGPRVAAAWNDNEGGIFDATGKALFWDDAKRRLARFDRPDREVTPGAYQHGLVIIEATPVWGYAKLENANK